jgi:chromosome segregation protein
MRQAIRLTRDHATWDTAGLTESKNIRGRRVRFNKIRLNGFKSFVDPTDLVIAEGLTGVVGPNGCGKSNLLEALRWVMGENRPTAMRGDGMEDVIFAGAATRPARNFAEVHVQIDNAQRLAPAGFNDADHIDIVRRITRDAGSAYKLNGKDVRARDVQMLFADAATGAHSPALVRQGQIAELINAKPKNRRRVLEDAAGIAGLYQRRHEAELKLRGAEQNLARIDDVLEQLTGQIASLARQAKQAARYRAIGAELRASEGLLLWLRWRDADARAFRLMRSCAPPCRMPRAPKRTRWPRRRPGKAPRPPCRPCARKRPSRPLCSSGFTSNATAWMRKPLAPPKLSHRSRHGSRSLPATLSGKRRSTLMPARPSQRLKPRPKP